MALILFLTRTSPSDFNPKALANYCCKNLIFKARRSQYMLFDGPSQTAGAEAMREGRPLTPAQQVALAKASSNGSSIIPGGAFSQSLTEEERENHQMNPHAAFAIKRRAKY
jgi:hypothetical protein